MKYNFEVKTGDQSGAGTDSNIFVVMYGEFGQSNEYRLNKYISGNAFERDDTDKLSIDIPDDIGKVFSIDLRSDNTYAGAAWLLSYIKITRDGDEALPESNRSSKFQINQWINDTRKRNFVVTDWTENIAKIEKESILYASEPFHVPAKGKAIYKRERTTTTGFEYTNAKTKKTTTSFNTEMGAASTVSATVPLFEALSVTASSERFLKFAFSRGFEDTELTQTVSSENKVISDSIELTLTNDTDKDQEYNMTFKLIKINVISKSGGVISMFSANSRIYFEGATLVK